MKTRIRKNAAAPAPEVPGAPGEVHRLHDMAVEEVSLVDRAANKRTFVLVKRDSGEVLGDEVLPDGRGGFRKSETAPAPVEKDGVTGAPPQADAEGDMAPHPAQPPPEAPKPPLAAHPMAMPTAVKDCMMKDFGAFQQKLGAMMSELQAAPTDEGAQGAPPAAMQRIQDALSDLQRMHQAYGTPPPAPGTPEQAAPNMPPIEQGAAAAAADAGRESAKRMIEAVKADIQKIGAKMAKERLDRFKSAFDALEKVLKELMAEEAAEAAAPASPEMLARPPKFPHVPATKKPNEPDDVAARPLELRAPARKADDAVTPEAVAELEKKISELASINKRQGEQLAEVARLRKSVPGSNAIPVEGDRMPSRTAESDVLWPRDMNKRPANKRGQTKDETFFE